MNVSDRPRWGRILTWPFEPLLDAVSNSDRRTLGRDAVAGLTVAIVAVPQSMAYAYIAGVPPQYGLYTVIFQSLVGALFSSQPLLSVGPMITQSLLVASTVTHILAGTNGLDPGSRADLYLQLVVGLTLLKGLIQLGCAAAQVGTLVRYVSVSVIVGFTAGAGVLIAAGQVSGFLGFATERTSGHWPGLVGIAQQVWPELPHTSAWSILLGLLALAIVVGSDRVSHLAPGPLIAVAVTAGIVAVAGWDESDFHVVGSLPQALPTPSVPWHAVDRFESLLPGALALAMLGLMESYAIGKSLAVQTGTRISANRELFSQGLTNFATSFLTCIPGSASFSRSALNHYAGAQTCFSGLFNAVFVLLIYLVFAPWAKFIPTSSLAAILFVIAYRLIDWRYVARAWRMGRADAIVCIITFLATLLVPLTYAIYLGVFLNIALYVRRASQLHIAEMVKTEAGPYIERPVSRAGSEGPVMFLQVEGNLFFGNADELDDRLADVYESGAQVVIFRLKRTHSIDATVLGVLERFTRNMKARGGHVVMCGLKRELLDMLKPSGLIDLIGTENVFETSFGVFASAKRAVARARVLAGAPPDEQDDEAIAGWAYEI